ncbi:MAG TPA: hypothetical protein DCE61_01220 [Cellvibrionales bacterium]|jgi:uncharacterized membrane protein YciS (DUF1049 family)|nr:hypothetical protein [Cellvibrionales bacterium]HAW13685.1 hypothetical protein [Cellvibrionales bacterium]HCX26953.1 hypothetical protein [Cellvibrionales bacterium]
MGILKTIFLVIMAILVFVLSLAFITHNQTPIGINLLWTQLPELAVSSWLIIFFVAGGLVGLAVSSLMLIKEKQARLRVEKRLRTTSKLITGQTS